MKQTVGQKLVAIVLSRQLGISLRRTMKLCVVEQKIHPSWEKAGAELLKSSGSLAGESGVRKLTRKNRRVRA